MKLNARKKPSKKLQVKSDVVSKKLQVKSDDKSSQVNHNNEAIVNAQVLSTCKTASSEAQVKKIVPPTDNKKQVNDTISTDQTDIEILSSDNQVNQKVKHATKKTKGAISKCPKENYTLYRKNMIEDIVQNLKKNASSPVSAKAEKKKVLISNVLHANPDTKPKVGRPSGAHAEAIPLEEVNHAAFMHVYGYKDHPLRCLVDSGAGENVLRYRDINNVKIIRQIPQIELATYADTKIVVRCRALVLVRVPGFGKVRLVVSFVENAKYGLLGLEFMRKTGAILFSKENRFYISYRRSFERAKFKIQLAEPIELPGNSILTRQVRLVPGPRLWDGLVLTISESPYIVPTVSKIEVRPEGTCLLVYMQNDTAVHKRFPKYFSFEVECRNTVIPINNLFECVGDVPKLSKKVVSVLNNVRLTDQGGSADQEEPMDQEGEVELTHRQAPVLTNEERQNAVNALIESKGYEQRLESLLKKHFLIFAVNKFDCGEVDTPIDFSFDTNFKRQTKVYPMSDDRKKFLYQTLDTLLFHGKIEESDASFGCPCFIVPRKGKDQGFRLIIDTRQIASAVQIGNSCQMEDVHSILTKVSKARWVSTVDICKAFFALRVSDRIKESGLNNLLTERGCYVLNSCLTGSAYAPFFLNRYLRRKLSLNCQGEYSPLESADLVQFFDDLSHIVYKDCSYDEYLVELDSFLDRVGQTGLRLSIDKCVFAVDLQVDTVDLLGFKIGAKKVYPNAEKLQAVKDMAVPRTLKELQTVLGSLQFIRHLLPLKGGALLGLLSEYSSADKFTPDANFTALFNDLKKQLVDIAVDLPFEDGTNILFTDASGLMAGGILLNMRNVIVDIDGKHSLLDCPKREENLQEFESRIKESPVDWVRECTPLMARNSLLELLYEYTCILRESRIDRGTFENDIIDQIYFSSRTIACKIPLDHEEQKRLLTNMFSHRRFLNDESDKAVRPHLETLAMQAWCTLNKRQIVVVSGKRPYYVGLPAFRSPLILMEGEKDLCVAVSWKGFLSYKPSLAKYAEHVKAEAIGKSFFKTLKSPSAAQNVRILGYYTQKHPQSVLKKPIHYKEMISAYNSLKFFEKTFGKSRTFLLSDNLPTKQLLTSMKSKDIAVYTLMGKLINEFPNIEVIYCEGKKNLADIFSRANGVENPVLDFGISHLPKLINGKYYFFERISDWVNFEGETVECPPKPAKAPEVTVGALNVESSETPLKTNTFSAPLKELVSLPSLANAYSLEERSSFGNKYKEESGVYYDELSRIVVPLSRLFHVIAYCHKAIGHSGVRKLEAFIKQTYCVTDVVAFKKKVGTYINSCISCLLSNPQRLPVTQGSTLISASAPMKLVSFDVAEFNRQPRNTRYNYFTDKFLVVICHYSGYVNSYPLSQITEQEVTKALMAFMATHGVPQYFLSDNAKPLHSEGVKRLLENLGVKRINSAVYSSRSRGVCERAIQSLRHLTRLLQSDNSHGKEIGKELMAGESGYEVLLWLLATNMYNHSPHTSKYTPHEILHSFDQVSYVYLSNASDHTYRVKRREWNCRIKSAMVTLKTKREKELRLKNKRRVTTNIERFDLVVVKDRSNNKNKPLYSTGIYKVIDKYSYSALIERLSDGVTQCRNYGELKRLQDHEDLKLLDKKVLGIVDFSHTTLCSQKPKLEKRILTRSQTRLQQDEDSNLFGEDEFEEDDEFEKRVRFN